MNNADRDRWLRRFHPVDDDAVPLVCFPHAGGTAGYYRALSAELGPSVEVHAVQYPGRMDRRREEVVDNLERLADLLVKPVTELGDRLAFFGHSMGALLAFEVARRLDVAPDVLFVSGRVAPPLSRDTVGLDDQGILAELRAFEATDLRLLDHPKALEMMMPVLRGDYRAIESYRYQDGPPLSCPIVALAGMDDPVAPIPEIRAWQEHCTGDFALREFPGRHFFLDEHMPEIAGDIRERLGRPSYVPQ